MAYTGAALRLNFSVCNELGVTKNSLAAGADTAVPTLATFRQEVDDIFGGKLLKYSLGRYELTAVEKAAHVGVVPARFSTYDVSYVCGLNANPTATVPGFLAGIASIVPLADVQAFIMAFAKMPGNVAPDFVILGKPKYRA